MSVAITPVVSAVAGGYDIGSCYTADDLEIIAAVFTSGAQLLRTGDFGSISYQVKDVCMAAIHIDPPNDQLGPNAERIASVLRSIPRYEFVISRPARALPPSQPGRPVRGCAAHDDGSSSAPRLGLNISEGESLL